MCCVIVPAVGALVTTAVKKSVDARETSTKTKPKSPFLQKLKWLTNMLWGGSLLLAFEHVWHGEITPWFPFLTNASNSEDAAEMLHEMATSGVAMLVLVVAVWGIMVGITSAMVRRADEVEA